jgi:Xaa-Pro aminopeptidase
MNLFQNKKIDRKIGPKIFETTTADSLQNKFKPRLYEKQINFDNMRMYRLNRVKKQLLQNDIGACILFDPINIRYATDARNMSMFTMHTLARYVFIPASGPVFLFDYPKSKHLSEDICTINETREAVSWDFFSSGRNVESNAKIWASSIDDLMKKYVSENRRLAIDICDPSGIQALLNNYNYIVFNAQKFLETARSIKSEDELLCMKASIETAEKGITLMRNKLEAGMTEEELWSYFYQINIENGGEWIETRLLTSGSRTNPWLQECSNRIIEKNDIVAFDTDMVGPYGYCADISRTFVEGHKFNEDQKQLYSLSVENIEFNKNLIKAGVSFREFAEKSWKLPENFYENHYPCMIHGIGMCDEWPFVAFPNNDFSNGDFDGVFKENMTITVESYIGEIGGKEGVKLEDQFLVTNYGVKQLSNFPLEKI